MFNSKIYNGIELFPPYGDHISSPRITHEGPLVVVTVDPWIIFPFKSSGRVRMILVFEMPITGRQTIVFERSTRTPLVVKRL